MFWALVTGLYYVIVTLIQLCAFVGVNCNDGFIIQGIENVKMLIQVTCKVYSIYRLLQHAAAKICSHLQAVHIKFMLFIKCAIKCNKSYLYICISFIAWEM
jgi:hypothetical protein